MMPRIIDKDGEKMVVDFMSGRRFPPDEEALVLGSIRLAEEDAKKKKDKPPVVKTTLPNFLRTN